MTRKQRIDPIDGWHHVMNRGVDRHRIFFDDDDRIEFGRCVSLACRRFGVELHAYCLLDNHFHLLLRCPDGGVSDVMHLACGVYATYVNRRHGRVGHLFGDRFTSRLVTTVEYIANAVRYIHRNALAINGIERCSDHRWSSHRAYLGARRPPDFMKTDVVLEWFGGADEFDRFVESELHLRTVAGTARSSGPDAAAVLSAVDLAMAERSLLSGRAVLAQRRAVALEFADTSDSALRDELISALEIESPAALASARYRAHRHLDQHPDGRTIIAATRDLVQPLVITMPIAS